MTSFTEKGKSMLFVAVHAGAGSHSVTNESRYKDVCKVACLQAMALLNSGASALDAVDLAVATLEDEECTNAGFGSNLSMQGCVECEASAMDGASLLFGAVGVVSDVKNPIHIASKLVREQMKDPLPLGRIRPSILVGIGARQFCSDHDIETNSNLTTDSTLKTYSRYKRKYQMAEENNRCRKKIKLDITKEAETNKDSQSSDNSTFVQDTVGAICVDQHGNVAVGASSGGIWLKHPGRIGPIAMYGTGCWAQNQSAKAKPGIAVVTSGCGEHLMSTILAKTLADGVRTSDDLSQTVPEVFQSSFLKSEFLARIRERLGGALILKTSQDADGHEMEFSWIHSTASMCFAFMTGDQKSPKAVMSRLDESCIPGQSFIMGGQLMTV